jgi:hypothetical protein
VVHTGSEADGVTTQLSAAVAHGATARAGSGVGGDPGEREGAEEDETAGAADGHRGSFLGK